MYQNSNVLSYYSDKKLKCETLYFRCTKESEEAINETLAAVPMSLTDEKVLAEWRRLGPMTVQRFIDKVESYGLNVDRFDEVGWKCSE